MYNDPYQPSSQPQPPSQPPPQQPQQVPYPPYDPAYALPAYGPPPGTVYGPPQGPQTPYGPPSYGPPPYAMPPGYMPPPQKKSSLTWLWITLGIVGGVLILGCAACGIFAYTAGRQAVNAAGPTLAATEYYAYLKQGDYNKAYSLVDPNATFTVNGQTVPVTNETAFTDAAQAADQGAGAITQVSASPQVSSGNTNDVTVTVTRGSNSYDVHLTLQQENGSWKVVSADGI